MLYKNADNVFAKIHKKFCQIDLMPPDEALVAVYQLIAIKIYDERAIAKGCISRFKYNTSEDNAVLAGNIRHLYLLGREDHKLDLPFRLSNTAIGEAVRILEGYSISNAQFDIFGCAYQLFIDIVARKKTGQFFTPEPIVNFIIDIISPNIQEKVIDPFCGSHFFLYKTLAFIKCTLNKRGALAYEILAHQQLHGIEKNQLINNIFDIVNLIGESTVFNVLSADALTNFAEFPIEFKPDRFDVVMTNPPFGIYLKEKEIDLLGDFELVKKGKGIPIEILAIERSIQFLKVGGRLAIIIPDGILSGKSTTKVRAWLAKHLKILAIISLPIETFSSFGAAVKTSILFGKKIAENHLSNDDDYDIFLGKIDNISVDARAGTFTNQLPDLEKVKNAFLTFIAERGW